MFATFHALYHGVLMANGSLTRESANEFVQSGQADLVSFGFAYIANPDLVYRLAHNLTLAAGDPAIYFMGDEKGYIDYAPAAVVSSPAWA